MSIAFVRSGPKAFVLIKGVGGPMDGKVERCPYPPPLVLVIQPEGDGNPVGCYHVVFDRDQDGYDILYAGRAAASQSPKPLRYRWIPNDA